MDPLDQLVHGLQQVTEAVEEPGLEPDPERTDWRNVEHQISVLAELTRSSLVAPFDAAAAAIPDPQERGQFALAVGYVVGEVAVLLQASSLHDGLPLLQDARRLGAGDPELDASATDPDAFAKLVWGRWRLKQGDFAGANRLFKALKASAELQVYRDAAQEGLDTPRPMGSAPSLWTLNGFGISLYGDRDRREDGTHVKTTYLSALFIPIFPLASYRVHDHGDGGYTFYAKQRLTPGARVWQAVVALGIVGAIAAVWLSSHYGSDRYKAKKAYAAAQQLDKAGKKKQAREAYENLLRDYASAADADVVNGAAKRLVTLYSGDVKRPITYASVSQVELFVQRFGKLPARARQGPAAGAMTRQLEGWITALGKKTNRDAEAGLALLVLAERVARGADLQRVRVRRRTWLLSRADAVAAKWPLRALITYLSYPRHPPAKIAAAKVLQRLLPHPLLLLSEARLVQRWLSYAEKQPGQAALARRVRSALSKGRALAANKERLGLLLKPREKPLLAYLKAHPKDQQVANAVAQLQRQRGATRAAQETLRRLGPPGMLLPAAQLTLANIYSDLGRLPDASLLLEALLAARLTRFRKAQRAYQQAATSLRQSLVARARAGNLPPDVSNRLKGLAESEQAKAFGDWMASELHKDPRLRHLREAYQAFSTVVPACLTLGMVKLRQARAASGRLRQGLLADAERLFLAIRAEADGVASYHIALGQVYYRLGKKAQGEKELQGLLARPQPEHHLGVAKAYRQLGMVDRARKVVSKVWENKAHPKEARSSAAALMAVMADHLDDEERWLKRADTSLEYVKTRLLEVQARRLMNQGKLARADALFAKAEQANAKQAAHNPAAANNAAITCQTRYWCTGDPKHLVRGYKYLEAARRLKPDNTVIVSNLASHAHYLAGLETLQRLLPVRGLRLGRSQVWLLLGALSGGPLRPRIVKGLQSHPKLRRCLELTKQEEVLAPERLTGYQRELALYTLLRDAPALKKLKARLLQIKQLQTAQNVRSAREYRAGKHDKRLLKQYTQNIAQREKLVKTTSTGPKAAHGAALLLLGVAYQVRAGLLHDVADARRAVRAFQRAHRAWPALGAQNNALGASLHLAFLEEVAKLPAMQKRWKLKSRSHGLVTFLLGLLKDPAAAPLLRALTARPETRALLTQRAATLKTRPQLRDWVLARLLKDAALVQLTRAFFQRPETRLNVELSALLAPWSQSAQLEWKLFQKEK